MNQKKSITLSNFRHEVNLCIYYLFMAQYVFQNLSDYYIINENTGILKKKDIFSTFT